MEYVQITQKAYNGLIDKPILTEELLNKPPFKFILDIISNIIRKTGYLENVISPNELDSKQYADKAAKTAFLDKLIAIVGEDQLSHIKSTKIVAGKEPQATNELLQRLAANARAASKKKENRSKSSDKPSKDKSKSHDSAAKEKKKDKDKDKDKTKPRERSKTREKENPKEKVRDASSEKVKKKKTNSTAESDKQKKEKKEKKEKTKKPAIVDLKEDEEQVVAPKKERLKSSKERTKMIDTDDHDNTIETAEQENIPIAHDSEADFQQSKLNVNTIHEDNSRLDALVPRPSTSARPRTASRPAPPTLKKKQIAVSEANVRQVVDAVAIFEESKEEEDTEQIFSMEEESVTNMKEHNEIQIDEDNMGSLVQKIMETKAELEESAQTTIEPDDEDDNFEEKIKVNNLKKDLQQVTRQTYPISQILEYAQEDIEMMMRELEKWRSEYRANEQQIKDMQAQEFSDVSKLSNTLSQLDGDIRQQLVEIAALKGRIAQNNEMIYQRTTGI